MLYPETVYSAKYNQPLIKPLLQGQQPVREKKFTFQKFGQNLGPQRPVISTHKYLNSTKIVQSPMMLSCKARRDTSDTYLVNSNQVYQQMQSRINEKRRLNSTFEKPRNSQQQTQRNVSNLTYGNMGVTNHLQSPNFYRSITRPSDTQAVETFYNQLNIQRSKLQTPQSSSATRTPHAQSKSLLNLRPVSNPEMFQMVNQHQSRGQSQNGGTPRNQYSKSMMQLKERSREGPFLQQYRNLSQMLNQVHAKKIQSTSNTASSLTMATKSPQASNAKQRSNSMMVSHAHLGRIATRPSTTQQDSINRMVVPEFFKTNNQHAFEQLKVGSRFTKKQAEPFSFTRYKQRAGTNYEIVPAGSHYKPLDNRQRDFQMRITVDNGEPSLPQSKTSVYRRVDDHKRFSSSLTPNQDCYRENLCQSFISIKNSRVLQKSVLGGRDSSNSKFSMKRKQGGGLFGRRVQPKPKHQIDTR